MKMFSTLTLGLMMCASSSVFAQSSSLYLQAADQPPQAQPQARTLDPYTRVEWMSPAVASTSLTAVKLPPPPVIAVHDLVTVIVRESTEADSTSTLETKKQFDKSAELSDIPKLRLMNEIWGLIAATDLTEDPKLGLKANEKFKGEGDYNRKDSFTTRITARVIDVKPNGTIVLEARKFIKSDKETLEMIVTGTARVRDIAADNTILSTQLYDLHLEKSHQGELKKSSKKGVLTKILETVFNF